MADVAGDDERDSVDDDDDEVDCGSVNDNKVDCSGKGGEDEGGRGVSLLL